MIEINENVRINENDSLRLGYLLSQAAYNLVPLSIDNENYLLLWSQILTLHGQLQIALSCLHDEGGQQYLNALKDIKGVS